MDVDHDTLTVPLRLVIITVTQVTCHTSMVYHHSATQSQGRPHSLMRPPALEFTEYGAAP